MTLEEGGSGRERVGAITHNRYQPTQPHNRHFQVTFQRNVGKLTSWWKSFLSLPFITSAHDRVSCSLGEVRQMSQGSSRHTPSAQKCDFRETDIRLEERMNPCSRKSCYCKRSIYVLFAMCRDMGVLLNDTSNCCFL